MISRLMQKYRNRFFYNSQPIKYHQASEYPLEYSVSDPVSNFPVPHNFNFCIKPSFFLFPFFHLEQAVQFMNLFITNSSKGYY